MMYVSKHYFCFLQLIIIYLPCPLFNIISFPTNNCYDVEYLKMSDRQNNLYKERQFAAGELYIPHEIWTFLLAFLSLCQSIYIALIDTLKRIAKLRVSKCIIGVIMALWKSTKIWLRMSSFFSSFLLLTFQFPWFFNTF